MAERRLTSGVTDSLSFIRASQQREARLEYTQQSLSFREFDREHFEINYVSGACFTFAVMQAAKCSIVVLACFCVVSAVVQVDSSDLQRALVMNKRRGWGKRTADDQTPTPHRYLPQKRRGWGKRSGLLGSAEVDEEEEGLPVFSAGVSKRKAGWGKRSSTTSSDTRLVREALARKFHELDRAQRLARAHASDVSENLWEGKADDADDRQELASLSELQDAICGIERSDGSDDELFILK